MPRPTLKPQDEILVGPQELADILLVGRQKLTLLAQQGVIPRHSHGRYDVKKAVPAYLQWLAQEGGAASASPTRNLTDSRADLYKFKAEREELELRQFKGELVDIEEVAGALQNAYALMRSMLLGIGSKLAPRLALITSVAKIRSMLDDEHNHVLNEFANAKIVNARYADSAGGSDGEADDDGGAGNSPPAEADHLGMGRRESEAVGRVLG